MVVLRNNSHNGSWYEQRPHIQNMGEKINPAKTKTRKIWAHANGTNKHDKKKGAQRLAQKIYYSARKQHLKFKIKKSSQTLQKQIIN